MELFYFFNGQVLASEEVKVHISDLSILRGYGVFDYLRTYQRQPLFLDHYLHRFYNSTKIAHLPFSRTKEEVKKEVLNLIQVNNLPDCGIRLVLTGGYSSDAFTPQEPNFFILIEPLPNTDLQGLQEGIKLFTYQYQREWCEAKTINYSTVMFLRKDILNSGAKEILYHMNGSFTEGSRSNFFGVKNNKIYTAEEGILKGITRKNVLEIASRHYEVIKKPIRVDTVQELDEAFITSSTKQILPVSFLNEQHVGIKGQNPVTKHLMRLYTDYIQDNL